MTRVMILGMAMDQPLLARLVEQLSAAGFDATSDVLQVDAAAKPDAVAAADITKPAAAAETAAAAEVPDSVAPNTATAEASEPPIMVCCWTAASVGPAGAPLHRRAIELQQGHHYIGLLVGDAVPPEAVRGAQYVHLAEPGEGESPGGFAPLIAALNRKTAAVPSAETGLRLMLRQIMDLIGRLKKSQRWILFTTMVTGAFVILGIAANVAGLENRLCAPAWTHGPCRMAGLGNIPSPEHAAAWRRVEASDQCRGFEDYLRLHGPDAPFAARARQRLDLAKTAMVKRDRDLPLGLAVGWSRQAYPDEAAARADFASRSTREANATCETAGAAMAGVSRPASFAGQPDCERLGGGWRCHADDGKAQCHLLKWVETRSCPR